jgi:hypothetical protein
MRRTLLAALVAGVATFTSTAQAAPSPQVRDPKGDWQVASQDVLSARVSSVLVSGRPALRGELTLAAAPAVPTTYKLYFYAGCIGYGFTYDWHVDAAHSAAKFTRSDCPAEIAEVVPKTQDFPATVTVKGTTLTWVAPYAGGVKRGTKVTGFAAMVYTAPVGAVESDSWTGYHEAYAGDVGYSDAVYVVGSDLK